MQRPDGQQRPRNAARGEPPDDAPLDVALTRMDHRATRLGDRRVKQIGAHRRRRGHAEQQHQQRRHQRAATHARHADDGAHGEAGNRVDQVHLRSFAGMLAVRGAHAKERLELRIEPGGI